MPADRCFGCYFFERFHPNQFVEEERCCFYDDEQRSALAPQMPGTCGFRLERVVVRDLMRELACERAGKEIDDI